MTANDQLRTVSFWASHLRMLFCKPLTILPLSLALFSCTAGEAEDGPKEAAIEIGSYANTPISRIPDDIRFFKRPDLLAEMRNGSAPMPEIVFTETDPWGQALGADSPSFALYEDGQVIYRAGEGFRSVQLSESELSSFRRSLVSAQNPALEGGYRVDRRTDQPDNNLLFYRGEPVFLNVYGSLKDKQVSSRLPSSVRNAFEVVRSFHHARAEPWLPEKIEVMVWPFEHSKVPSLKWKSDWPDFSDPGTVRRGDSYSLFMPSAELANLRAFLATRELRTAIEIDGRKWSAAIRIPFPQEELWMSPNTEMDDTPN